MKQNDETTCDPYAEFPASASIEADGYLLQETDKALLVQLADGRGCLNPLA
jgi:hypothetical protein